MIDTDYLDTLTPAEVREMDLALTGMLKLLSSDRNISRREQEALVTMRDRAQAWEQRRN